MIIPSNQGQTIVAFNLTHQSKNCDEKIAFVTGLENEEVSTSVGHSICGPPIFMFIYSCLYTQIGM